MESLSDTKWDVVISGTGLQQSLLALALSRSGKKILHVDSNEYYGGSEAVFSLQEVEDWASRNASESDQALFSAVTVKRLGSDGLSLPRAYSLALAPQLIHTKSELLAQLVSSKAFRQVDFLAVGSFFVYQSESDARPSPELRRIPATREDVFSNTAIPAKSKRVLMKFLKFVLDYTSEAQEQVWKPRAGDQLVEFLQSEFKLDVSLCDYIITLTLSLDRHVTVEIGLAAIHRHMTSMGVFGPGFAAVYPKWGGLSEIAQVACRAGAVGGAVYMLGTGIRTVSKLPTSSDQCEERLEITLANDTVVSSSFLAQGQEQASNKSCWISRLTCIVDSGLPWVFKAVSDDAPVPGVAVVGFPPGSISLGDGQTSKSPVYATIHSCDTGECPAGQSIIYLSTLSTPDSSSLLQAAMSGFLKAQAGVEQKVADCLYQVSYDQSGGITPVHVDGRTVTLSSSSLGVAFDDSILHPVRDAWDKITADDVEDAVYMKFEDREGAAEDGEIYD